jgi:hypothetical protein
MKKLLFTLTLLVASLSVFAQTEKPILSTIEQPGDCPFGMCQMAYLSVDVLNFHKPRTECLEKFGFCIRLSVGVTCVNCFGKSSIDGSHVNVYAGIEGNSIVLHIPSELKFQKGYENVDFKSFEIDDDSIEVSFENGAKHHAIGGSYDVEEINNEFVVHIPLK